MLALFYVNTKQWIAPLKPLYKFGTIKLIIFVLFWQSVAVAGAGFYGIIQPFWTYDDVHSTAAGIEDFAITIELFFFSILAHFFFSYRDFWAAKPGVVPPLARVRLYQAAFLRRQATADAAHFAATGHERAVPLTPAPLVLPPQPPPARLVTISAAALDVLPIDIVIESGKHARTVFGLRSKWHKRRHSPHTIQRPGRRRPFPLCCLTLGD